MKIVVLGAGAVGGYFGGKLAQAGLDVTLAARGAHLAAIRERGLTINDSTIRVSACDGPGGDFDLALLAVKSYDTEKVARAWASHVRDVVSLQNGLGNEEALAEILGPERAIGGVAYVGAEVVAPGRIAHTTAGWLIVGEMDGRVTPRVEAIRALFSAASVRCDVSTNIVQNLWEKLLANAVFNSLAAAYGVELGDLVKLPHLEESERAADEVVAVARAEGVEIRPHMRANAFEFCRKFPTLQTSTQQDVTRGRPIEYEAFNGEVVRRAKARGVRAPTHEKLYDILRKKSV